MDKATLDGIKDRATQRGYDVTKLVTTTHSK
jgi:hypothetical protein